MADIGDIYTDTRLQISDIVRGASEEELARTVPATPEWTVKDVAAHLAADATCVIEGDFPSAFFQNFGAPEAVEELNRWTARQIDERKDRSVEDILAEWEKSSITLVAMMRGEQPWPGDIMFADRILLTDETVHQFDLFGALGIAGDRNSAGVKLASAGYIATLGWRLQSSKVGCLRFKADEKEWIVGGKEPDATVEASRFEILRALSGRRSPEQIRAYDWTGDPDPFIAYFYPYGIRSEPLHE